MAEEPSGAQGGPPPPPPHWAPPPPPPPPHGQPGYGAPPPYGQPGYGPPPHYGQPGYGSPPYGQPPAHYVQARPTNGFAIASMVLGIVWIYWLGSVLAVVFGHIALHQFRQNPHQNGRGMAIAGVVLGWIGVGVLIVAVIGLWAS